MSKINGLIDDFMINQQIQARKKEYIEGCRYLAPHRSHYEICDDVVQKNGNYFSVHT